MSSPAWNSNTPLEHVRLENRRLEALDGIQRNFFYPWPAVAAHVPSYRTHALTQLARMGAEHPIFRTQYLNETLNAVGRLFSESQPLADRVPSVLSGSGGSPRASNRNATAGQHRSAVLV